MKEFTCQKTYQKHTLIRALGITSLALLVLVSIAGASPFAYVTNSLDNNVSVIDTATDNVVASVDVGIDPIGVAVSSDGTKVYVTNYRGYGLSEDPANVSVIDTATNQVVSSLDLIGFPGGVAVNPDNTKVYVTDGALGYVSVIDTATNNVIAKTNAVGTGSSGISVTPDGKKVYVSNAFTGNLIINASTNELVQTPYNIGGNSKANAITNDGKYIYIAEWGIGTKGDVLKVDTSTDTIVATTTVGVYPWSITVTPDGTKVYVANLVDNNVSVIDTTSNTVITTVPVGINPWGISVTPDGKKVFVVNSGSNNVSVIDTLTNTVIDSIKVGERPNVIGQFIVPSKAPPIQPVLPVADFTANFTFGFSPFSVQFTDLSQNATGWYWDFGDGANSTQQSTTHVYTAVGNFTVNLTVSNDNNTASKSATIRVIQYPLRFPPSPDGFIYDLNGNGRLDFADVVTYFNNMAWIRNNWPIQYFDYNRNGRIDFSDVVMLFNKKSS